MKVFLSWSGERSKQLASLFKEWLPNVLQFVEPYMSAQDIEQGERWNNNITSSLSETDYGLIFVTPENIKAPWINYEAGALSKSLSSRVVPVLFNAEVMILQEGPLKQFQSTKTLEKESVLKLVKEINSSVNDASLDPERLNKAFEMWWGELEKELKKIPSEFSDVQQEKVEDSEMLAVIIKKLNDQDKVLKDLKVEEISNVRKLSIPNIVINDLKIINHHIAKVRDDISSINDREGIFNECLARIDESLLLTDRVLHNLNKK